MSKAIFAAAGLLACLSSCGPRGGSDVGNGATATLDVGAYKRGSSTAGAITLDSGATVDELWLSVGSFRLQGGASCGGDGDGKLVLDRRLIANLAEPDAAPGKSEPVTVEAGAHCRLRVALEPVTAADLPGAAPAELEGAVLFVRGARADGVPFTLRSTKVVDLRLDAIEPDGFELDGKAESPQALVVAFDLEEAVGALDLDELDDATIVIDDKTNKSRLVAFENSLRKSASLFEDGDADGVLVDTESAAGNELARGEP